MPSRARPKSNPGLRTAAFLIWGASACLVGVFAYARFGPGNRVPIDSVKKPAATSAATPETSDHDQKPAHDEVNVVTAKDHNGELKFSSEKVKLRPGDNRYIVAVNGFLKTTRIAPVAAKLVSASVDDRGVLILSFNEAFDTTYGSEDERTLVEGILESVRQFQEVQAVRFQIGSQPLETLGHLDLTEDQPVR